MLDKAFDFLISTLRLFQFWVVIYPNEKGVWFRLGKLRGVLDEGLHWCLPFKVDSVQVIKTVLRTARLGAQSLITQDQKPVVVNTVVSYQVHDAALAILAVHSVEHTIDDVCSSSVAGFAAGATIDTIVGCCARQDATLLAKCRDAAVGYGLTILRVQFCDVSPCRTLRLLNTTSEASSHWDTQGGKETRL